jgi:hypothetical protein
MDIQRPELSPRLKARIAGLLYLGTIIAGMTSMLGRSAMIVRDDAAATVAHILAAEPLYRLSIAAEFLGGALYIGVTVILYGLLKPVNRTASLAAAAFSVAGCAVGAAALTFLLAPTVLIDTPAAFVGFAPGELQAMVLLAIRLHGQAYTVSMLFFGVYCAMLGHLTLRSTFLPNALGVLLVLAGLGWLTDSFAEILSPAFDRQLDPWIEAPGFIGETALCIWLIVVGVNSPRWLEAKARTGR